MPSRTAKLALIWSISMLLSLVPAVLLATQQWAELRESPKAMSWTAAVLYQAPSWLLLGGIAPGLVFAIRRKPIGRDVPARLALHLALSVLFGAVFLLIAVPARQAFHAHPVQWRMFGDAIYKSAPQFMLLGAIGYWLVVVVASLIETRSRLHQSQSELDAAADRIARLELSSEGRINLTTVTGVAVLESADITWIEPAPSGARVHTTTGPHLARHTLADLEHALEPHGIVRVHRSTLVNLSRISELVGGRGRDGQARLDTGDLVPISRRRRNEIESRLEFKPQT